MASDRNVELLTELPPIGLAIAKAAVSSRGRGGAKADLPERTVMVADVSFDINDLADYAHLVGLTLTNDVPGTYLHVQTFALQVHLMAARDFPFAMAGMVHVANEMTVLRPVGVAEKVTLSSSATNMAPHRSGLTLDLVGEARVGDELVWRGTSTYLVKGASMPSDGAAEAGSPEAETPGGAEVALQQWAQWRTTTDLGRRYAAVAGDVNPIHMSGLAAKAFGFPTAIAHGMWTHAKVMAALQGRIPANHTVSVEFRKPILLGSTVAFRAGMTDDRVALSVTNRSGDRVHLTGQVVPLADSIS